MESDLEDRKVKSETGDRNMSEAFHNEEKGQKVMTQGCISYFLIINLRMPKNKIYGSGLLKMP